ncbi:MAG: tyrosine--tRNA ligase [Phycisphaerales bacterium]|nr:tyrosine--tRNA ligase [Phycisphaerales bacterium]
MTASANPTTTDFLADLRARGLIHQCTDEASLTEHLRTADMSNGGRRAYVGFDPTADSLTIGNLVGIITLGRWQRAGHTPIVVTGGGTGLIGDPSGKSAERQLLTPERVAANVRSIKKIFSRVLDFAAAGNSAVMTDNYDWLGKLTYLDALRDIGKHFSVNMMIQKDSVRERLHNRDQGISYTEFSYMILQSYDFLHLHRERGVTLQMGGSDQWGNIVGGCDLIRRAATPPEVIAANPDLSAQEAMGPARAPKTYGLTWPLVTKADGTKFGKTESGAIWLSTASGPDDASPSRTSPYQFYQFWLNAADADVVRFLKTFTFIPVDQIAALEDSHTADPGKRTAHRALARHMTEMLHGPAEADKAEAATRALFSKPAAAGDHDGPFVLPPDLVTSAPSSSHDRALLDGVGIALLDLLPQTSLAKSKTEARTLLSQNSVSVNGRAAAADARLTTASLLEGSLIALRKGKKNWHLTRWG